MAAAGRSAPKLEQELRRMNLLVKTGLALTLLSLATTAHAQVIADAHVSQGPYGEACAGVYVFEVAPGYQVVCVGKGVITPHAIDCVVYADNGWTGLKACVGV